MKVSFHHISTFLSGIGGKPRAVSNRVTWPPAQISFFLSVSPAVHAELFPDVFHAHDFDKGPRSKLVAEDLEPEMG